MTQENERRVEIILSGQKALVGSVGPNLRNVQVGWTENQIHLYFIYNGAVLKEDIEEAKKVAAKIQQDFPADLVDVTCQQVDYPQSFPIPQYKHYTWLYVLREVAT